MTQSKTIFFRGHKIKVFTSGITWSYTCSYLTGGSSITYAQCVSEGQAIEEAKDDCLAHERFLFKEKERKQISGRSSVGGSGARCS